MAFPDAVERRWNASLPRSLARKIDLLLRRYTTDKLFNYRFESIRNSARIFQKQGEFLRVQFQLVGMDNNVSKTF